MKHTDMPFLLHDAENDRGEKVETRIYNDNGVGRLATELSALHGDGGGGGGRISGLVEQGMGRLGNPGHHERHAQASSVRSTSACQQHSHGC